MNTAEERARYDAALQYAQQALKHFQFIFNSDAKISNLIISYLLLECAIRSLGEQTIQDTLEADPEAKNIVADIQKSLPAQFKKFSSIGNGEPDNIIYVDFKKQGTQ
jgi:hypothetical protein